MTKEKFNQLRDEVLPQSDLEEINRLLALCAAEILNRSARLGSDQTASTLAKVESEAIVICIAVNGDQRMLKDKLSAAYTAVKQEAFAI